MRKIFRQEEIIEIDLQKHILEKKVLFRLLNINFSEGLFVVW